MKIGVFTVLFGDKPFEETLDYVKELGLEAVEIGTGAYPGDAHCKPARAAEERQEAEGVQGGDRLARSGDQRAQLPRQSDPPRQEAREGARRGLQADGRARGEARRQAGDHVLRLPRRRSESHAAELDHVVVASRVSADARVAVEGARRPVLEGDGEAAEAEGRARRDRDAPELRRLQPGDDAAAVGRRAGHDRVQLRSQPHVLAAGGRADGDPRARRPHLPRAREGLQNRPGAIRR